MMCIPYLPAPDSTASLIGNGEAAREMKGAGFTLIELLVVMAIIATLLTVAVPRYFHSLDESKEAVLHQDLSTMRDAIDHYYGDTGKYPNTLAALVTHRYLKAIPVDPITDSAASWVAIPPDTAGLGGVYDVRSGAKGKALDGTSYNRW